jgi:hypothetical protein
VHRPPLSASQLALGSALLQKVPNPFFGLIPRSSSLGDPTITVGQLMKPFPEYTTVSLYRNNVGTTRYQGLELSLRQRLAHGLTYSIAYTRSKLVDDASSVFDASILTGPIANYPVADSVNRSLERDYSTGDIPHVFVSSIVWNVRGWTVASVVTLESGVPIAVTQTTNSNAFAGFGVQRPNLVGDATLPADGRSPAQWFNTAAFAVAPQFTIGSASRNPVRGPSYRDVDLAVTRRIAIGSRQALEIRAEIFNLLNTPVVRHGVLVACTSVVLCGTGFAQDGALRISGAVAHPMTLTREEISTLPHQSVTTSAHDQSGRFDGVALIDLLKRAGVPTGEAIRGAVQRSWKFTVTVMMIGVGTPFSSVGVNFHCRTASSAAASSSACDLRTRAAMTLPRTSIVASMITTPSACAARAISG